MNESSRAVLDDENRRPTVGERLDGVARRVAARHRWTSAVGERLVPPLRRAEQLAGLFAGRFERDESGADAPDLLPVGVPPGVSGPAAPGSAWSWTVEDQGSEPARGDGRPLPADVRARLRDVAGAGAEVLRVHDDGAADRVALAHAADAVTIGTDVYFRDGRFRPDEPEGFRLLAHETTHVSATVDGHGDGRASAAGRAAEEQAALGHERLAEMRSPQGVGAAGRGHAGEELPVRFATRVGGPTGPPPGRPPSGGLPTALPATTGGGSPPGGPTAASTSVLPMAAAADRPAEPPPPPFDVEALRRDLVADLMSRLRSDFERGA